METYHCGYSNDEPCVSVCVLTVTANEKPSNLPLNAGNPLTAIMAGKDLNTGQQIITQTMAQKVSVYLQHNLTVIL